MYNFIVKKIQYRIFLAMDYEKLKIELNQLSKIIEKNSSLHPIIHYQCSAAHLLRGYILRKIGDIASSELDFKEAIFQDHQNHDAINALKHSEKTQNIQLNYLNKLLTIDPQYAEKILLEGIVYFLQNDLEKALESLNNAIAILKKNHHKYHFDSSILYYNRGAIFYQIRELDLSKNDLNKSLELYERNQKAIQLREKITKEKARYSLWFTSSSY